MGHFKSKRVIPNFSKPATNLNIQHNKEWRSALPKELSEGDIIAGLGVVKTIFESCDGTWYIEAGDSTEDFFSNNVALYSFTRKAD